MKRQQPIRKVSTKRAKQMRAYNLVRIEYLLENSTCERCHVLACEIHHLEGKNGELLINKDNFMAVCRPCHLYIEANPTESLEKGWRRLRSL